MYLKKILSLFLVFVISFFQAIPAFAKETAYILNIKKSNAEQVKNIVEFYARQNNMPEVSGNSEYTYVMASSLKDDYWLALYENVSDNVCFYLYSPSDKSSVLKDLKIRFKKNNLHYSNDSSKKLLNLKKQDAENIIKNMTKTASDNSRNNVSQNTNGVNTTANNTNSVIGVYDFSDEAQARFDANRNSTVNSNNRTAYRVENVPKREQLQQSKNTKEGSVSINQNLSVQGNSIPPGVTLIVLLQSAISTSSLAEQDRLSATLKDDVKIGNVVIPSGSLVYGSAIQTNKAGGAYRNGTLTVKFDRILSLEGEEYSFNSKPIVLKNTNSGFSRPAKISGRMAAAIITGVAFAALSGAVWKTEDWGKTLTYGAMAGAFTGGLSLVGANGEEIELKEGSPLTVVTE